MTPPPSCTNSPADSLSSSASPGTRPRCRCIYWAWFPPRASNHLEKQGTLTTSQHVLQHYVKFVCVFVCELWHQSQKKQSLCERLQKSTGSETVKNIPLTCVTFRIISLWEMHFHPQLSFLVNKEGNHFQVNGGGQAHLDLMQNLHSLCSVLKFLIQTKSEQQFQNDRKI